MTDKKLKMMDGNEAAASVAHRLNEVVIIYPITPSSPMAELSESWAAAGEKNIWGAVPQIVEMQSEAGAIGAVHGSLQAGALTTTFTASQGLLLMIPNMYKIAGELTPFVMHVAARTVATHALSIFGDHSDVMACRQTGFAMLASASVQEAHDMAAIASYATFVSRVPFLHFFDGFRTSHELNKAEVISTEDLVTYFKGLPISGNAERALTPDAPVLRGTAQNPDVFFQIREAQNPYYDNAIGHVETAMKKFAELTGRKYGLADYYGAEDAETVMVLMGSGSETAAETAKYLNEKGAKYGVINLHLFRPFPKDFLVKTIPATAKTVIVLDRTKEPGAGGDPLYLDVRNALCEALEEGKISAMPKVMAGRYGLSSKDFTPAMVKAVFENTTKNHFTVGINDDLTHHSLEYDETFNIEPDDITRCVFYGLGADGTVGANKNSIKIIAGDGGFYGQAYFVYDSKKSGAMTTSHLRFSKKPIKAAYVINHASFVACHHFPFLEKLDMLKVADEGATFLLNAPYSKDEVWDKLPRQVQKQIIDKKLKFYTIDAEKVAKEVGMGRRINTIMQTCFFALSGVLPKDEAITAIKHSIEKTYSKKGREIVENNFKAVDGSLANLYEVTYPASVTSGFDMLPGMPKNAPEILQRVTGKIIEGKGDELPVSAFEFTADGTWPTATACFEKRRIAVDLPSWDPALCIQCGKCATVCPHAAIRIKVAANADMAKAPEGFKSADYKMKDFPDSKFIVQVAPEDCTGCTLCMQACPSKSKEDPTKKALGMVGVESVRDAEIKNFDFFMSLPDMDRTKLDTKNIKHVQLMRPLFEFSGCCAGCGETPYIKLLTQLCGDRLYVANATGCSSIYGGNLPTTPYAKDANGRGPAWANSLFEDNAEFGLGMRTAVDFKKAQAARLLQSLANDVGPDLTDQIFTSEQKTEAGIKAQRERVSVLKTKLQGINKPEAKELLALADYLVNKSVWIIGGDGWGYDIGYGGVDHVLHSGKNVKILIVDTGVYSNTGGQKSKATPIGASAKFAASGSDQYKKDIGMIAMSSRKVYVASVALGANDMQTVKAFSEAESYDGPALVIAYAHCIAHGYELKDGLNHQKLAVETGLWPLYRFDPRLIVEGKNPMQLDSRAPAKPISEFMDLETRFKISKKANPERYETLVKKAQEEVNDRRKMYEALANMHNSL